MARKQLDLFGGGAEPAYPEGFRYRAELITAEVERALLERVKELPLKEFEFHGFTGKRRTVSFGWHYSFADEKLRKTDDMPDFLLELRETVAPFADLEPEDLQHVLVTEYGPGAAIGWHRDKGVFEDIIGISLLSPCTFRLRRARGESWERVNLVAEPRSAYLMRGPSRTEWEHSIPAVEELRYSITFRSLKEGR